jgi:hypothetical protein
MPTPDSILAGASPAANLIEEPAAPKSDLPGWLSDLDAPVQEEEDDLWKNPVEQEEPIPASIPTVESDDNVSLTTDLPDWLQGVEEESTQTVELVVEEADDDDVPPWMHREQWEADEPRPLKPTSPSDWQPVDVEPSQPVSQPVRDEEVIEPLEPVQTFNSAQTVVETPEPVKPAAPKKKSGLSARQTQPEALDVTAALNQAKDELARGDIPAALARYEKLIKKGKHLDETIRDLNESLYRYPVEVGIWQTLGDAYMRSNRLKEALEAYNKAEELIR